MGTNAGEKKMQKETKALQKRRLADLNTSILPKFKARESLQKQLDNTSDPVLIDSIEMKMASFRNEVVEQVIKDVPDFLDAIAYSWNNNFQYDEAMSYIYENLINAIVRYKTNKIPFCKFTSFFWMYNKNLLRNKVKGLKAAKRDKRKTSSLDSMIASWSSDEDVSRYDSLIVKEKSYDVYFMGAALRALYKKSTPKQKRILKRLYLGYSQSEIARILGVTGTNVNTVIRKMRQELTKLMY